MGIKKDNNAQAIIDQLRSTLTLQLEAYQQQDWQSYRDLEETILDLEQKL